MVSFLNKVVAGAMFVGSSLGMTSCDDRSTLLAQSRDEIIQEYMADSNPREYERTVAPWRGGKIMPADAQSTLDSLAYRNIYNNYVSPQDSATLKEFNSIAAKTRITKGTRLDAGYEQLFNVLDNKMYDMGLTLKQKAANEKEYKGFKRPGLGMYGTTNLNEHYVLATRQFKADSMAYEKFLKEKNLMNKDVANAIKNVAKKIKPAL